jgi:hypothetical protein
MINEGDKLKLAKIARIDREIAEHISALHRLQTNRDEIAAGLTVEEEEEDGGERFFAALQAKPRYY